MASQQNRYYATNPPDGTTSYDKIRISRAPDSGGAPGAFGLIATVNINAAQEYTEYLDTGGEDTSWYRHTWYNSSTLAESNPSAAMQADDSVVRQWLKADIPDADLDNTKWSRWIKQTLVDLYNRGIWKPGRATITITKAADNTYDEWYDIPSPLRDVIRVEKVSNDANLRHHTWLNELGWEQVGRQVRFIGATSTYKYVVHGKAQFTSIGELTDDFFMLAYRMVRLRALQYRLSQRANFYKAVTFDKTTDIMVADIRAMIVEAQREIAEDIKNLALPEPTVPVMYGRYGY